jgi:hypothetical protein
MAPHHPQPLARRHGTPVHYEQTARRDAEAALLQAVRGGTAGRGQPDIAHHVFPANACVISFLALCQRYIL